MRKTLICLLIVTLHLGAQNIDSLYTEYLISHESYSEMQTKTMIRNTGTNEETSPIKCMFDLNARVKLHWEEFSSAQKASLKKVMDRPFLREKQEIVSPAGYFRIHYTNEGPDKIGYSIDELAAAFDSAYNFEVNILGYPAPPKDDDKGGDDLYDIYVRNKGDVYGETFYDGINSDGREVSYIALDNDFSVHNTKGIDAAKVTAAHEFHHAIQTSHYGWPTDENEIYYYEITSTAMEEFVFTEVNDYYYYLSGHFNHPEWRLYAENMAGYRSAILHLLIQQKFERESGDKLKGLKIIKRSWEYVGKGKKTLEALNAALSEVGSSLKQIYSDLAIWCWFTGDRAIVGKYFTEGRNYPEVKPLHCYEFISPKKTYMLNTRPITNNYIVFDLVNTGVSDSLVAILTNADVATAVSTPDAYQKLDYSIMDTCEIGAKKIVDNYYSKLSVNNISFYNEDYILNDAVIRGTPVNVEVDYAYPQPFKYGRNLTLNIPTKKNQLEYARLNVYSMSMDLVYSKSLKIISGEKIIVQWDGRKENGEKLPTGVYIYVTDSDGKLKTGKIVIYND